MTALLARSLRGRTAPTTPDWGHVPRAAPAASVGPARTAPTTGGQGYTRERGAVHVPTLAQDQNRTTTFKRPAGYGLLITNDGGSHEGKESPPI